MSSSNNEGLRLSSLSTFHLGPIDWVINRGSSIALSGASGCGKSLLLRAIADLDPHEGEVLLDDVSARSMAGHLWRQHVGLLPAEPMWWSEKVGDHFDTDITSLLEELALPNEALEWTVSRCSTGERQRLALIRLLQNNPDVLLLDEATAALDQESVARVEALVQRYQQEQEAVVIWVSHDPKQRERVAQRHFAIVGKNIEEVSV